MASTVFHLPQSHSQAQIHFFSLIPSVAWHIHFHRLSFRRLALTDLGNFVLNDRFLGSVKGTRKQSTVYSLFPKDSISIIVLLPWYLLLTFLHPEPQAVTALFPIPPALWPDKKLYWHFRGTLFPFAPCLSAFSCTDESKWRFWGSFTRCANGKVWAWSKAGWGVVKVPVWVWREPSSSPCSATGFWHDPGQVTWPLCALVPHL